MAFVHGRPAPHPFHSLLARSVGAEFALVDRLLRHHDRARPRPYRYLSWLLNAVCFPSRGRYDVFLTEGLHLPPVIMRRLRLLRKGQQIAALLDNETLYFLAHHEYSRATEVGLTSALRAFDALVCVGRMQAGLARGLVGGSRPRVLTVPSAVPEQRAAILRRLSPSLASDCLVFIANGPSGWRLRYKGLDLVLGAFERLHAKRPRARLRILGEWSAEAARAALSHAPTARESVEFLGQRGDITPFLASSSLCLQLGRGDAFAISALEAGAASVPTIVSCWTGASEVVERVEPDFVVPLDPDAAAAAAERYLSLAVPARRELGERFRKATAPYTEGEAVRVFREAVLEVARPDDVPSHR